MAIQKEKMTNPYRKKEEKNKQKQPFYFLTFITIRTL